MTEDLFSNSKPSVCDIHSRAGLLAKPERERQGKSVLVKGSVWLDGMMMMMMMMMMVMVMVIMVDNDGDDGDDGDHIKKCPWQRL